MDEKKAAPATATGGKPLTDEDRDTIMLLYEKGLDTAQIAQVTKVGKSTADFTRLAYERAKNRDIIGIRANQHLMNNTKLMRWACKRARVDYDALMDEARGYTAKKEDAPEKPPADLTAVEDAITVAARLIQDSLVTELRALGEKIDRLNTMMQSCCNNAVKTNNANHDTLYKEVQKQTELLSWIKSNTKPRYGNQIK